MSTTSSTAMTPIAADITSETLVAVGETTVETDHMKDGSFTFATEIGSTTVDRLGRLIHSHGGRAYYARPKNINYIITKGWRGVKAHQRNVSNPNPLSTNTILPTTCFKVGNRPSGMFAAEPVQDDTWAVTAEFVEQWAETGIRPARPLLWYCNKGDLAEHYTGDLSILLRKAQPSGEVSGGKREIAIGGLGKQTAPSIGERTGAMWTEPREVRGITESSPFPTLDPAAPARAASSTPTPSGTSALPPTPIAKRRPKNFAVLLRVQRRRNEERNERKRLAEVAASASTSTAAGAFASGGANSGDVAPARPAKRPASQPSTAQVPKTTRLNAGASVNSVPGTITTVAIGNGTASAGPSTPRRPATGPTPPSSIERPLSNAASSSSSRTNAGSAQPRGRIIPGSSAHYGFGRWLVDNMITVYLAPGLQDLRYILEVTLMEALVPKQARIIVIDTENQVDKPAYLRHWEHATIGCSGQMVERKWMDDCIDANCYLSPAPYMSVAFFRRGLPPPL